MVKRFDEATFKRRIEPMIERWFMPRTKAELEAMAGHRIALTPIKSIDEVVADPHLRARAMFVDVATGDAKVEVFGSPMKLSATPVRDSGRCPRSASTTARSMSTGSGSRRSATSPCWLAA